MTKSSIITTDALINGKYILLDWNVFQYLKSPRKRNDCIDTECIHVIDSLRRKYHFPVCESHMRDLQRSNVPGNEDIIKEDLNWADSISKGIALVLCNEELCMAKCSSSDVWEAVLSEDAPELNISSYIRPEHMIDMEKLDSDHPLRPFLEKTNGLFIPNMFEKWLSELFDPFFNGRKEYENFRSYLKKLKKDLHSNAPTDLYRLRLSEYVDPFLDALDITDIEQLSIVWKDVILHWLRMSIPVGEIPEGLLYSTAYTMLDLHPLFNEPLKKKNRLSNITRDSKLVFFAHKSDFLVTEDSECAKKAAFILSAFGTKTKVINMEQFVKKFS